jgi:hypothetical protein
MRRSNEEAGKSRTLIHKIQHGWRRFWSLPWRWKAPALAGISFVLLVIVGAAVDGDATDDVNTPQTRPSATLAAAITASPTVSITASASAIPSAPNGTTESSESTPTSTSPALDPIGPRLGGTRDAWISMFGQPVHAAPYDRFGMIEVTWQSDTDGIDRALTVEILYPSPGVNVNDARSASAELMPSDSTPVRTYTAPAGQTVEVFFSDSLAGMIGHLEPEAREAQDGFLNGEPEGTFIRIAERGSPVTSRVLLAAGNNP